MSKLSLPYQNRSISKLFTQFLLIFTGYLDLGAILASGRQIVLATKPAEIYKIQPLNSNREDLKMTPEQKELVQKSFEKVGQNPDEAAAIFYNRLFEIDSSAKELFAHSDMKNQGRKLMDTLKVAVVSLDKLDKIVPVVENLGERHAAQYHVQTEHYASVGQALIWTLAQYLGEDFTPEHEQAWLEVYTILAGVMQRGAARQQVAN